MVTDRISLSKLIPYLAAIFSMIFFGMSFIWTKILLQSFGPLTIIFLRLFISSFFLSFYFFLTRKIHFKKAHLKYFMGLAFFEPFLYFLGENFGVKYVSPTIASMIISTIPLVSPIFVFLFLKEKLNSYNLAGLIVSFIGVLTVLLSKNSTLEYNLKGIGLLFFAVAATIGYSIIVKKLTSEYSSINIVFFQNLIGFFYFLPFVIAFEGTSFSQISLDRSTLSALLQLSFFASTLAFILLTKAIAVLGVNKTNVFINLIPVVTAIFSFVIFKNMLSIQEIVGILIVIGGLFLSQFRRSASEIIIHEDI
ncbi:MAG: DMT family transporter [Candidatus Marinimicrobia bacterium]|nr:DMT family transporter [Candidatus Neomarinimicrobiota bacterium]